MRHKSGRQTTQLFVEPDAAFGDVLELSAEEAHHASRVLRLRVGDEIVAVDGSGGWYRAHLERIDTARARGRIIERRTNVGEPDHALILAVGLIKQPARLELIVEKAVELGVTEILFIQTNRSERADVSRHRLERIARAALKQSGRSRLPLITGPSRFADLLASGDGDPEGGRLRLLCHEQVEPDRSLTARLQASRAALDLVVFIGP
jgi:16S rRNA (uracil1498-N3)-methyltransferase